MDAEIFQFLFGSGAGVEEEIVDLRVRFLAIGSSQAGMDRGPAEDGRDGPFLAMDEDALSRRDLVIDAAIAFKIEEAFGRHIVDEPADLVGMRFDDDLERRIRVDDAYGRAIRVGEISVYIWFEVFEPDLLTAAFETYGGRVVDVSFEEIPGFVGKDGGRSR